MKSDESDEEGGWSGDGLCCGCGRGERCQSMCTEWYYGNYEEQKILSEVERRLEKKTRRARKMVANLVRAGWGSLERERERERERVFLYLTVVGTGSGGIHRNLALNFTAP